jgi:hypothetical protein
MKAEFTLTCAFMAILIITLIPTAAANRTIEVINLSRDTYTFTYQQLAEMPLTNVDAELFCYGSLVASGGWSGVQLSYLLTQTNVSSEVKSIQFTASDSYTVTIPIQLALAPETIIAYQYDGAQIVDLRLVLPGVNGASWINQIVSINMGNNEVDAPAAAAGTGARGSLSEYIIENRQTPPVPTFAPNQTQPTPKPVPGNSTINQIVPPSDTSESNQSPQSQTEHSQSKGLDGSTIALIATVLAVGSAIATILVYKNKMKLGNTSHN